MILCDRFDTCPHIPGTGLVARGIFPCLTAIHQGLLRQEVEHHLARIAASRLEYVTVLLRGRQSWPKKED